MTKREQTIDNLDEQITAVEAEIDVLQRRWKPYARIQPGIPGRHGPFGMPYDPTRFLEKSEIAIALDGKQMELAQLQQQRAEIALSAYDQAGHLTTAETDYREAEAAFQEAQGVFRAAQTAYHNARGTLQNEQERHARLTGDIARAKADYRRWAEEQKRDRDLEESVARRAPSRLAEGVA